MHNEYEIVLTAVLGLAVSLLAFVVIWVSERRRRFSFESIPLPAHSPFDGPGVSCTCKNACGVHVMQPESAVVGSNYTNIPRTKIPRIQVALYSENSQGLVRYLGVATRIEDWLVTPTHVIVAHDKVSALSTVSSNDMLPTSFSLDCSKFEPIEGDLSAIKLAEAEFSRLGLMKASLATMEGPMLVSAASSSKDPEMSFGMLNHDAKVFGGVLFSGSTKGGFSGAAYMSGKQIAGVHLGGGVCNYGLSATYISALLKKPEETAEWLTHLRETRGALRYQRSKFNPDEAIVFANGKYHNVDLSLLEGDIEIPMGEVYAPTRRGEVNVSASFPPQYRDAVEPLIGAINVATTEIRSKNLEVAEQECSAEQADEYLKRHMELMSQLDEKFILLQALQDSVSNRYREVQKLLVEVPKTERTGLVEENEKLKKELSEIKQLKTTANVEVSSLRPVPQKVRKAKARGARATMLDKLRADGIQTEELIKALVEAGLVIRKPAEDSASDVDPTVANIAERKPSVLTTQLSALMVPNLKP
jgi:hypothetical protein